MKASFFPMSVLIAAAALAAAGPAFAQREHYEDSRYEDEVYEDERYESDPYDDERYYDERYDDERYGEDRGYADDDRYERLPEPRRARFDIARVVDVDPIVDVATRPVEKQDCREQPLPRRASTAPAAQGILASVLSQPSPTAAPSTTRRCTTRTEYVKQERITGYDVAYRYRGRTYYTVTSRDPGETIRIALE